MDYKSLMGYGKKKKLTKKKSKSEVNNVLESVKEEFGYKEDLKEVGMASDIKKYTIAIDKDMINLANSVNSLKELLIKNGAKKEALELGSIFVTNVGKFRKFIKIKFLRMLKNLI
jgi:chemotaxis regulatin CheY-phosphate phosphatase CheZ